MLSAKHTPICLIFIEHAINLVNLYNRLKFPRKTRGYCVGVGGKDTSNDAFEDRKRHLFKTIVSNTGSTSEKRAMISSEFLNMKTRGKAVSIGPLEYLSGHWF